MHELSSPAGGSGGGCGSGSGGGCGGSGSIDGEWFEDRDYNDRHPGW